MSICSLDGRRALVTGAAGGLGAAISEALANSGADVALADLDLDKARKLSSALTEKFPIRTFTSMEVDVTSEASVAKAFEHAVNKLGGLDTLVTVAGIFKSSRFEHLSFSDWRDMLACHLDGTFLCARAVLPGMLRQGFGRIICISSVASLSGVAYEVSYGAAKGGIDGLVRSLAREVASRGVTVNAIAPGYFDTPVNLGKPLAEKALITQNIPVGRFGRPEEVGTLAVYLASQEAAYTTGQVISPNGAFTYGAADLKER